MYIDKTQVLLDRNHKVAEFAGILLVLRFNINVSKRKMEGIFNKKFLIEMCTIKISLNS